MGGVGVVKSTTTLPKMSYTYLAMMKLTYYIVSVYKFIRTGLLVTNNSRTYECSTKFYSYVNTGGFSK